MLESILLYIKQGLNAHLGAFSPIIIIEDHIYRLLFTHSIGNSGIDLIMNRYKEFGLFWKDFLKLEPSRIEELIYPPKNIRKNDIPMPDFELYYERMMTKGSRVNMFYCWLDYKSEHPNGYQTL